MNKYVRIARFDHWIKQFFIVPGIVLGIYLMGKMDGIWVKAVLGFFAVSFAASANYVINEYLDAEFDKYHPTKKNRPVVLEKMDQRIIIAEYILFAAAGGILSYFVNLQFFTFNMILLVMGLLYNVPPVRLKDVAYLDVICESANNAIRLMLGWFIAGNHYIPPVSIVIGYWMAGAFLMAMKRFSEFRMIGDKNIAAKYRKSFGIYTEYSLLVSSLAYSIISIFLIGTFLIKYHLELILDMPLMTAIYCYYFYLSFQPDSSVQKPEKLYKETKLLLLCVAFALFFVILMGVDIPWIQQFLSTELINIPD